MPQLWAFPGVRKDERSSKVPETVKQSTEGQKLGTVIDNYDEVKLAFRHTDVY